MAPTTPQPEAPPAASPPPPPMFTSLGISLVLLLLLVEGVAVYLIARHWGRPRSSGSLLQRKPALVTLDVVTRELPAGAGEMKLNETVLVEPVVWINPTLEDLEEMKAEVESRKALLVNKVIQVIQGQLPTYFRKPDLFEDLALLLKRELNQVLGRTKDGQDVIDQVLFNKFRGPVR